jgi:hypothetical protein
VVAREGIVEEAAVEPGKVEAVGEGAGLVVGQLN